MAFKGDELHCPLSGFRINGSGFNFDRRVRQRVIVSKILQQSLEKYSWNEGQLPATGVRSDRSGSAGGAEGAI
jgi:hypothetical protein